MRKSSLALASCLSLGGLALGAMLAAGPPAAKTALAAAGDPLVVTGDGVNVRFGPSTNTRIRQRVARGQQVMELQREGEWLRVEIVDSDGREGWIHGSLLAPPGGQPLAAAPDAAPAPGPVQAIERPAEVPAAAATVTASPAAPEPAPMRDEAAALRDEAAAMRDEAAAMRDEAAATPVEGAATAPGEVAVIAPETATTAGETLPAVGQPAAAALSAPATIEPAAAPPRDEAAELARFRESVDYLNSRALSVAGVDLFSAVEVTGDGVVQIAATEAWSSIPPGGQQSYANTLLDRWAAARGYGGPVSVQIVDPNGQVLLETTRP